MTHLEELQMQFINQRLGTFIHFNSATVQFQEGEIKDWEYFCENKDDPRRFPFPEHNWNPSGLDCGQWARAAGNAGCRFAALTAKHHEGFALWPTAYSVHSVQNAACQTDVVAEYLKAFRSAGIRAGLYFSILDLTAGIGHNSCTQEQKKLIFGQITELLTHYGEIPFLIVDGWNSPWGGPTYDMLAFAEVDALVKSLQPNCLFMNIGCRDDIANTDIMVFENAAGQEVDTGFKGPGISCNKLTDTWFWRQGDSAAAPAPASWALEKAEEYFRMNVNFMLNLSPNPDGGLDENLVQSFARIGEGLRLPPPLEELPAGWMRRTD